MSLRGVAYASSLFLWNNIFQPIAWARGAFPAAQVVLAVLVGSYALNLAKGAFRPRSNFMIQYGVLLFGWILIVTLVSPIPRAVDGFIEILKYVLPLMMISTGLRTMQDVKLVTIVLTLSVGVWSAQAGVHGAVKGVTRDMAIPGGQMTDNNDFMAAAVSILPMLVYMAFSYKGKYRWMAKWGGLLMAALTLCAIVFSQSRGAALGLCGTGFLYVTLVSKRKVRDAVLGVAVTGVILLLLPDAFWDRMSTIRVGAEQTEGSAQQRMHMMISAYRAVLDHPLFGVGPECWGEVAFFYSGYTFDPHNIWLKLTTEIGVPGLILYLGFIFLTIWKLYGVRGIAARMRDPESSNLATALIMVIIGFLLPSTFLSHPFSEWLWAWLAVASAFLAIYGGKAGGAMGWPGRPRKASRPRARQLPAAAGIPPPTGAVRAEAAGAAAQGNQSPGGGAPSGQAPRPMEGDAKGI